MPFATRRALRRAAALVTLTAATTLLLAGPASAHITVGTDDAHQGAADTLLTFRVPTEEDGASTVKLTISFPRATPIASVKPGPKPGWTIATTVSRFDTPITTDDGTVTEGVTQVVYTASSPAAGIPSGQFDTFQLLVGPLPATAASLSFPTVQAYSNGKTVSWVQPVTDPAHEPDNPAPSLRLLPAAPASPSAAPAAAMTSPSSAPSAASTSSDGGGRTLAIVALVVAVLGVLSGAGGIALARRRAQ